MNKTIARCTFISASIAWIVLSLTEPWVLGDSNRFLKNFVNHEILNFLGVIVAITLASSANIHLEFNKIEERAKERILSRTRISVKKSAFWLIGMLVLSIIIVVSKPHFGTSDIATSLVNGAALLIILFNVLILIDLTQLVFSIEPHIRELADEDTNHEDAS